ncbi:hypothetical protein ABPG72_014985 [Tetrahymena utriculariae]
MKQLCFIFLFLFITKKSIQQASDQYDNLVIKRQDYTTYCQQDYRCMMGFNSCSSYGYVRSSPSGQCSWPSYKDCLNQTQQNCFTDSVCVIEMKLIAKSSTDFTCQIPQDLPEFQCSDSCKTNNICKVLGYYYYYQNQQINCVRVFQDQAKNCQNKPLCSDFYIDSVCRSYGFVDRGDGTCRYLEARDCLLPKNYLTYCNGPKSPCVQQFNFTQNINLQTCTFDCLKNQSCNPNSFCLQINSTEIGSFGYSSLNSLGKCYINLSLNDCINYKSQTYNQCPQACISKYNLIQSSIGCIFPPHSACDNATEQSQYGCSTDKLICKELGWTQVSKGSNKCQDPTNICLSQSSFCNTKDNQSNVQISNQQTALGNYLGLFYSTTVGWTTPTLEQCDGENLCQKSQSFCRKAGFIYDSLNFRCKMPNIISDCLGQEKCSEKLKTICKKQYGFSNPTNNQKSTCVIPQNCSQLKKLDIDNHACEIGGFVSLDKNMNFVNSKDIYNNLDLKIDFNNNIILSYCITQININNPICSQGSSVCNLIGFSTNTDGTCKYPQIETCLVPGSGKCSSNNICLRFYKLEKSQTSDDCVIPNNGDYTKCQDLLETPSNQLHYCFAYFGFNQVIISKYCSQQTQSSYCNNTFICDIFDTSIQCNYTKYIEYNNYIQYSDIEFNNPLDYTFTKCTQDQCPEQCTQLGFTSCKIPQIQDCKLYDENNYNHACHMMRAMNAVDIAKLCLNSPNCSKACQFYGFILGQDNSCQIPDSITCSLLGKTLDTFYHACGFQNFLNPNKMFISQFCLRRGLKMCSSNDSICIKYYNFSSSSDGSGDCQNPDVKNCLNLNQQIVPINCQVMVGFLLKPIKQLFTKLSEKDYGILRISQQGLALELGYLIAIDGTPQAPQPFDCLKNQICATPARFGSASPIPYQADCINQGFSVAQDGKSCFVDVNTCIKQNSTCTNACLFSGFALKKKCKTCLIMDKDQFYCDRTYKVKSDYCKQLGYKWVNDHYEYPTHAECEDNSNGYCGQGKITCTERGWTSINGQCLYKINCLDKGNNYCQNSISICFYLGYIQSISTDINNDINYDCVNPTNLDCSLSNTQNCASKKYSICVQQGFTQNTNSQCTCSGVVYQGVCFIINANSQGATNFTIATRIDPILFYLLVIMLLLN